MTDYEKLAGNVTDSSLDAGLHLVSTPIGRARDITLHALDLLKGADVLVAEDTRVLRKLMSIHGIPVDNRALISHHDHSSSKEIAQVIAALEGGKVVAYASDAGTPMVSDPGYRLVTLAIEKGIRVHSAPGASAMLSAVVLAGLPSDKLFFAGFLSSKSVARRDELTTIKTANFTSIFYDTPKRLRATLRDALDVLQGDRSIVICREITKRHEQVERGTIASVFEGIESGTLSIPEKGELVILFGPAAKTETTDEDIKAALKDLIQTEGVKRASNQVADELGLARNRVYKLALSLKDEHSN